MTVTLAGRPIGPDHPPYVCFDVGATHTGLDSLVKFVDATPPADAIKFHTVYADSLISLYADLPMTYATAEGERTEQLHAIHKRRELSVADWKALSGYCHGKGVTWFSTPDSPETVDLMVGLGASAIKISGGDMTHLPLIEYAAGKGLPMLLDTRGTLEEIDRAVTRCVDAGNEQIIIVYCPSGYPAKWEALNLSIITTLKHRYPDMPIGYSDHSDRPAACEYAVAAGADFIESTLTLDPSANSPEHIMSETPSDVNELVTRVRETWESMGSGRLADQDLSTVWKVRRSVAAKRDIGEGHVVVDGDLTCLRPGTGIPPARMNEFVGLTATRRIKKGELIEEGWIA